MKCVEVRGVKIGEGIPKIIVPIVGTTEKEILDAAVSLRGAVMDLTEWRADYFDGVFDFAKVERVLKELRKELGSIPILFTFRTSGEGGEKEITVDAYAQLCIKAAQTGLVDLIDVEAFTGEEVVRKIIEEAHRAGVKVVASNHDFDKTPAKDDIVSRLRRMQEMAAQYADRPIITMSMSGTGLISRLCGEVFGSACTFGAVGRTSAPGQIGVEELDTVLKLIHNNF